VSRRSTTPKLTYVMQWLRHALLNEASFKPLSETRMSNTRNMFLAAAFAVASIPAAFADTGVTWVGGETGFTTHPVQSTTTRALVRAELMKFQSDGGQLARGEFALMPHELAPKMKGDIPARADPYGVMGNAADPARAPQSAHPTRDPYFSGGPN
jgi:hypothetical protein